MSARRALAVRAQPRGRGLSSVRALLLAGLGLLAGCAMTATDNPFEGGEGTPRSIQIDVQNLNFNDATLYALSSGRRYRMGTVSGSGTGSFDVPWTSPQDLRIEIDVLAGGETTTRPVSLAPGEQIRLFIQADVRRSYIQQ